MKLYIKTNTGKEVEIHPVLSTRQDIVEMAGEQFTLGKSDYKYFVWDIYAKPSPDTSFIVALIFSFFMYLPFFNIWMCILSFVIMFCVSKIYFAFDKKAVEKFNNS